MLEFKQIIGFMQVKFYIFYQTGPSTVILTFKKIYVECSPLQVSGASSSVQGLSLAVSTCCD